MTGFEWLLNQNSATTGGAAPGGGAWSDKTVAQIEEEIQKRTEACLDEKKNEGYSWFTLFGNREANRGTCEGYARQDLAGALATAQSRENQVIWAVNDATTAQARWQAGAFQSLGITGGQQPFLIYLAGFVVVGLILFLLFKK